MPSWCSKRSPATVRGCAVAQHFALGGAAAAQHANDHAARLFFENSWVFASGAAVLHRAGFLVWLPIGLLFWQFARLRRNRSDEVC